TRSDLAGGKRWREAGGEIAGREPHLGRDWHLRVYDAGLALLQGRLAEAETGIDEVARTGRRVDNPCARGVERALRAILARERGDYAGVLAIFDPTRPIRIGPVQFVQGVVGRALAAVGRRDAAAAVFEDLMADGAAVIPRNIRWYATIAEASLLAAELRDEARAKDLLPLLEP